MFKATGCSRYPAYPCRVQLDERCLLSAKLSICNRCSALDCSPVRDWIRTAREQVGGKPVGFFCALQTFEPSAREAAVGHFLTWRWACRAWHEFCGWSDTGHMLRPAQVSGLRQLRLLQLHSLRAARMSAMGYPHRCCLGMGTQQCGRCRHSVWRRIYGLESSRRMPAYPKIAASIPSIQQRALW